MNNIEDQLRFPIGRFSPKDFYSDEEIAENISRIESLPLRIESVVRTLSDRQLDTPYREGGWTARQVLHHIPDSHINAYVRVKWALTEDSPLIKAYDEKMWAETPDINSDPELSLQLLKALHARFSTLLKRIPSKEMKRSFVHPDTGKAVTIERMTALYSWHGDHHLGHLNIIASKPK